MNTKSNKWMGAGIFSAITASLCCIAPILAMISGVSGMAASLSWLEPTRPYFIGITLLVLGFAWHQKIKSRRKETECACDEGQKPSFWRSAKFLGIVSAFALAMLAFPYYAKVFYPSTGNKAVVIVQSDQIQSARFSIQGMTCQGCAVHVESEVNKLEGIISVEVSYEQGNAKIVYNKSKLARTAIETAINDTGYKVVEVARESGGEK